jgi:hypothetical protein
MPTLLAARKASKILSTSTQGHLPGQEVSTLPTSPADIFEQGSSKVLSPPPPPPPSDMTERERGASAPPPNTSTDIEAADNGARTIIAEPAEARPPALPALDEDVLRIILELAAREDKRTALRLAVLSRRIGEWCVPSWPYRPDLASSTY